MSASKQQTRAVVKGAREAAEQTAEGIQQTQNKVFESLHHAANASLELQRNSLRIWGLGTTPTNEPTNRWMHAFEPFQDSLTDSVDQSLGSTRDLIDAHASYTTAALDGIVQLARSKTPEEFTANVTALWDRNFDNYRNLVHAQITASESLMVSVPFWNLFFDGYQEISRAHAEATLNLMKAA